MLHLSSTSLRAALEALLFLAVLSFILYDLSGSTKERPPPSASQDELLPPFRFPESVAFSLRDATLPSALSSGRPYFLPSRLASQTPANLSGNSTLLICGTVHAPAALWNIGSPSVAQALVFQGSAAGCLNASVVLQPNSSTALAGVRIAAGSLLSLEDVQNPAAPASVGGLVMEPNSTLAVVVPAAYQANPHFNPSYILLNIAAPCPALVDVNVTVKNCPTDLSLVSVGSYVCAVAVFPVGGLCAVTLSIAGALSSQAPSYLQLVMSKDCSQLSQAAFTVLLFTFTGVPVAAIVIPTWQCGSVVAVLTVLGSSPAQAQAALNLLYQAAVSGPLASALGVLSASIISTPTPTTTTTTTSPTTPTSTSTDPTVGSYYYSPTLILPTASSSNPALFALFALLALPLLVIVGLVLWACLRKPAGPAGPYLYPMPLTVVSSPTCTPALAALPAMAAVPPFGMPPVVSAFGSPVGTPGVYSPPPSPAVVA